MDTWPLLESLPRLADALSEAVLRARPGVVPGVYLLWRAGELVYIGHSGDIARRLAQHRKEATKVFDRATFFDVPDHSLRLRTESVLILAALPAYNRHVSVGIAGPAGARHCYDYQLRFTGAPRAKAPAARARRRRKA